MNPVLVTTTIRPPVVLEHYRRMAPDVPFLVAGDLGCDDAAITAVCDRVGNAIYLSYADQARLGFTCHEPIGARTIQRRNIAILQAVAMGAEAILTIDDDNIPAGDLYLERLTQPLRDYWTGTVYQSASGWLNVGHFGRERYTARGFPYRQKHVIPDYTPEDGRVRVGVASSLILGDPDINATERIERRPEVECYFTPHAGGFAISPKDTWAPINSQATVWTRDLAPLMLLPVGVGRYDDIWGSYIAQRVLMETDYHVYFGQPYVRQERNAHDLMKDLRDELFGMTYTERFCDDLKTIALSPQASILDNLATLVDGIGELDYVPAPTVSFARAWVEDMGRLL